MQLETETTIRGGLPARLPKGFVIGPYVIDAWLRDGGMAAIYRAHRVADEERVAIKLQLPSSEPEPALVERFDREAEVLRRASGSQHVVDLLDAGVLDDGRRYLVLEWVVGENLEELLDSLRNMDRRLPIARACRICRDTARGLAELHEHGVVHLDLKPANVMVRRGADGREEIKLVDLGIAADLRERGGGAGHAPGSAVLGSSAYVAPEQLRGCPAAPSSDVYALGVLAFEAISGSSAPPHQWMPEPLPRLETLRYGVPAALADLVQSCMEVDPQRRPKSAQRVAAAMVRIIGTLEAEERRSTVRPQGGPVRTGRTEVAPRSDLVASEECGEVQAVTEATEGSSDTSEMLEASGPSVSKTMSADASVDTLEDEVVWPMRRPWLRWMVLGAAATLVMAWMGLDFRARDAGSSEGPRAAGQETLDERVSPGQAPKTSDAAALASGRSLSGLATEPGSAATKPASGLTHSRRIVRRSDSCKQRRTEAGHAKAKRQWQAVLRTTASGRGCWTGAAQRLERRRLRVEALLELREYERCVAEGEGSRDEEILQGVTFCRTKLVNG